MNSIDKYIKDDIEMTKDIETKAGLFYQVNYPLGNYFGDAAILCASWIGPEYKNRHTFKELGFEPTWRKSVGLNKNSPILKFLSEDDAKKFLNKYCSEICAKKAVKIYKQKSNACLVERLPSNIDIPVYIKIKNLSIDELSKYEDSVNIDISDPATIAKQNKKLLIPAVREMTNTVLALYESTGYSITGYPARSGNTLQITTWIKRKIPKKDLNLTDYELVILENLVDKDADYNVYFFTDDITIQKCIYFQYRISEDDLLHLDNFIHNILKDKYISFVKSEIKKINPYVDTLLTLIHKVKNRITIDLEEDIQKNIEINETIEKHDTLNPLLFDENNNLKDNIKEAIEKIVATFIDEIKEDGIKFELKDIVLVGSNVSYNYTKDSDLDIHIIADSKNLECPDNLYPLLYSAYRSIFNKNYDIKIKGIPAEIYVELDEPATKSNGIYSIQNRWVKEPIQTDIPDINMEEFNREFQIWENRYFDLIGDNKEILNEKLESMKAYMLRNDGKLLECGEVHPYIKMSLRASFDTNLRTLNSHPEFLDWFYKNTLNSKVKELIDEFKNNKSEEIFDELNNLTNQEFCRVRTSNYKIKYGGDNGQIYFRISSNNFNWFDLIWNIVNKFAKDIKEVTVMKDKQSLGGNEFEYYYDHLPIDEFLTLKGNPILEDINEISKSEQIENFIEDLYDLRKKSIQEEGEYGLGNLIFKEFRNLGYLDNLKELRKQYKGKELSLEQLEEKVMSNKEKSTKNTYSDINSFIKDLSKCIIKHYKKTGIIPEIADDYRLFTDLVYEYFSNIDKDEIDDAWINFCEYLSDILNN